MAIDAVFIPPILCALGVVVWNSENDLASRDAFLRRSKKYAKDLPDRTRVRSRLARIGREDEYATFRLQQLSLAFLGAAIFFVLGLLIANSMFPAGLLSAIVGVALFFLIDHHLSREVTKYRLAIESEFASIIEMLTLSLSAGETPLNAMSRISNRSRGVLACEFSRVVEAVRNGGSFHDALDAFGRRVDSVVIRRFVDSLINAMMRGAPLVEVLQRHAAEARQNQRNILMDKAGKAEISMMVPVVFLILPISVLFALWPSLTHLNLFAS